MLELFERSHYYKAGLADGYNENWPRTLNMNKSARFYLDIFLGVLLEDVL